MAFSALPIRDVNIKPLTECEAWKAVEQASTFAWERYTGLEGRIIGMKTFGSSAAFKELQMKLGFKPDCVVRPPSNCLVGDKLCR